MVDQQEIHPEKVINVVSRQEAKDFSEQSLATVLTHPNPTTQILLTTKPVLHTPEAGVNSLVDAAAYLFSIMGKLRHIKSYKSLGKLHQELVQEIKDFQETVQAYGYQAERLDECMLVSTYILCVTLDDVIANMPWGNQGKWDEYSLVTFFKQEPLSHKGFLIILERFVQEPAIYIDMMEFIYICLSLGFKCRYHAAEFSYEELEQITNSLYKHIRAYRGNISKTLAPFSIKSRLSYRQANKTSVPKLPLAKSFSAALFSWQKLFKF
jgi:type VI secretion system protein ImpK